MKQFLKKIAWFLIPIVLFGVFLFYSDFFKVFKNYDSYTKEYFVALNREFVCLKTFEKVKLKGESPNSFIFGSSRSQAFKCEDWNEYLSKEDVSFHFDANSEGVIGILKKLEYLKEKTEIKNALFVFDMELLSQTNLKEREFNHLTVSHPEISKSSYYSFYSPFIKSSFTPKFILSYYDYSIFRNYRGYMRGMINESKYPWIVDSTSCDIFYGIEKEIKEDSMSYYSQMIDLNVFSEKRDRTQKVDSLRDLSFEILEQISQVLKDSKTNFIVIISPLYNQVPFNVNYLNKLYKIFGKDNVLDYSGINAITSDIGNYYEQSHYRPHVARIILKDVNE